MAAANATPESKKLRISDSLSRTSDDVELVKIRIRTLANLAMEQMNFDGTNKEAAYESVNRLEVLLTTVLQECEKLDGISTSIGSLGRDLADIAG